MSAPRGPAHPGRPHPRIGIDYGPAASHGPGIGRYGRELVRALVRLEPGPELALLELRPGPRALDEDALGLAQALRAPRVVRARLPRRVLEAAARLGLGVERWLGGVELFHDLRPVPLPVRRARRTWALSELPPPGSPAEGEARRQARRMDRLIAFSGPGARLLAQRLELSSERVAVTPVGAEHFRRTLGVDGPLDPSSPPYVLFLGRLDRARRPLELLAALERLHAGGLRVGLTLAGRRGDAAQEVERALAASPLGELARWIEDPSERDLPELVARAAALCHLAPGELTAVTPLEALAAGVPVVVSPTEVLREALATEAEYLGVDQGPPELGEALVRCLAARSDPAALARRLERAAPFTWEACARSTLAVWEEVLAGDRDPAR